MSEHRSKTSRIWSRTWMIAAPAGVVLVILVLALAMSNVALLRQNRALKQSLQVRSEPAYLALGQPVSTLRGLDLRGEERNLELADESQKTVLLIFQPTCQWCRKNMDNWSTLLDQADHESYRFLAISTRPEGVADYIDQYQAMSGMPMIVDPHLDDRLRYRLFDTPQTIVIDSNGVVEKIWLGALGGRLQQDVESYFDLALPGVSNLS